MASVCGTYPMSPWRRASRKGRPFHVMDPLKGMSSIRALNSVDLPAPLTPTRAQSLPLLSVKVMSWMTGVLSWLPSYQADTSETLSDMLVRALSRKSFNDDIRIVFKKVKIRRYRTCCFGKRIHIEHVSFVRLEDCSCFVGNLLHSFGADG